MDELAYMRNDFAKELELRGVEVEIDGEQLKVFISPVQLVPGGFERGLVEIKTIYYLPGTLSKKVPDQIVDMAGERYLVRALSENQISGSLVLERGVG